MGGCLPILITMPLFVAFFAMLQVTAELRFTSFLWTSDLSAPDTIWRLPFMPDGHVSKVGQFIQLSGGHGPDGLAIDETGGLVVAHFGLGSVWHFSPLGEPLHRIRSPLGLGTTNIAFGGPDRRTLFITESESGSILAADLPVAGAPIYGLS